MSSLCVLLYLWGPRLLYSYLSEICASSLKNFVEFLSLMIHMSYWSEYWRFRCMTYVMIINAIENRKEIRKIFTLE